MSREKRRILRKIFWPKSILARFILPLPVMFAAVFIVAALLAQRPFYRVELVRAFDNGWVKMEFDVEILAKKGIELETSYENQYADGAMVVQLFNRNNESVSFDIHLEPCSSSSLRFCPGNSKFLGRADSAGKFDFYGEITDVEIRCVNAPRYSINYWGLRISDSLEELYRKIPGRPRFVHKGFQWFDSVFKVKGQLEPFSISDHLHRE